MTIDRESPAMFSAWANSEGYDIAHTYDTDRSRWVFFNPMTAELWECWQAARRPLQEIPRYVATDAPEIMQISQIGAWVRLDEVLRTLGMRTLEAASGSASD